MSMKRVSEINEYIGSSVNPMATPDQMYELYSVPSFETGYPEIVSGAAIGSTKVTVEEGDILICKINPRINRVWVVRHNTEYPLLASSEWIVVRNSSMNPEYLKWYFSSPGFRTLITSQVTGIGGSLTRAQPKQVANYLVPTPSREEQDIIADILTRIENLISKHKQQIDSLDQLVKSRFIELFENEEYEKVTVSSVLNTGFWLMPATPEFIVDGEVPYITSKNIKNRTIDFYNVKYISREAYKSISANRPTQKGDILVSMIGTLGQTAVIQDDREFYGQNLYLLRLNNAIVNTTYFCEFFNSDTAQYELQGKRNQSTQAYLKANHVEDLILPLPPMELQKQFAAFVKQTDKSKLAVQQGLQELEILKESLMQQYFG